MTVGELRLVLDELNDGDEVVMCGEGNAVMYPAIARMVFAQRDTGLGFPMWVEDKRGSETVLLVDGYGEP